MRNKELAQVTVESEEAPDLQLASGRPREAGGVSSNLSPKA